jgi:large subunit ribosomal protein L6
MSRVANSPVTLPAGVQVSLAGQKVSIKGPKGSLSFNAHAAVKVAQEGQQLKISVHEGTEDSTKFAGTARAVIANMVNGVTKGYQKDLELVGVGFKAQAQGKKLNLSLGFSHPIDFPVPEGITIETPEQTKIVIKGADKHMVGQVAAKIRAFRPPEPYKGKGVRHAGERVVLKEGKKK